MFFFSTTFFPSSCLLSQKEICSRTVHVFTIASFLTLPVCYVYMNSYICCRMNKIDDICHIHTCLKYMKYPYSRGNNSIIIVVILGTLIWLFLALRIHHYLTSLMGLCRNLMSQHSFVTSLLIARFTSCDSLSSSIRVRQENVIRDYIGCRHNKQNQLA